MENNNNKTIKSQEVEQRTIEVKENGDVMIEELLRTIYIQSSREFLSEFRMLEKWKQDIEETLKPEFLEKQQKNLLKITEEIDKIKDFVFESDKKNIEYNKKEVKEAKLKKIREELNKKEQNFEYLSSIYENVFKNDKDLWESLTSEEQIKFKKIKLNSKIKSKR